MDHYEELGLDRTATEEDIKRAHRRLAKLLHPDQQTDEAVKQLADTQMRRLNGIVEILSDPEQRREYDDQLRDAARGFPASKLRKRAFASWPWWVGSTVGAVVLTLGAVWFFADKWGSSFGNHAPTYIPSGAEASAPTESARDLTSAAGAPDAVHVPSEVQPREKPAPIPVPVQVPVTVPAAPMAKETRASKPTVVVAELPRHKLLKLPLSVVLAKPARSGLQLPPAPPVPNLGPEKIDAVSLPAGSLPAPPKLVEPASSTLSSARTRDTLEGEWVYAPKAPEKRKSGFYPPEFINLKIWDESGLHGEYHARYHVVDKPIPSDVNFQLAPDGNPRHFTWISNNGSKGTLQVSAIDADSIRIEWHTTVFSRAPALTAGTATLVRHTP